MIFSLKLQGLFGDKDKSTRQVVLKTIMNTGIHVILEISPDSFGMDKRPIFSVVPKYLSLICSSFGQERSEKKLLRLL